MQFYLKNWNQLAQFKYYFLNKGQELIGLADNQKIQLFTTKYNNKPKGNNMPFNPEKLKEALKIDHYHILHRGHRVAITAREFDCLKGIGQGRAVKEIGLALGLSPRTVEGYLNNLKNRLGVDHRSELVDIYLSSDLIVL